MDQDEYSSDSEFEDRKIYDAAIETELKELKQSGAQKRSVQFLKETLMSSKGEVDFSSINQLLNVR